MLIVVNPVAGGVDKEEVVGRLLADHPRAVVVRTTGGGDEALVRSRLGRHSLVVVIGGDGTVGLVARLLAGSSRRLAVIPAGSANGFAGELGISAGNAAGVVAGGRVRAIDTLRVNGRVCVHLADVGFNARLVEGFGKRGLRGWWGYAWHALRQVFAGRPFDVRVGDRHFRRVSQVTFANGRRYGSGVVINPEGVLDDGLFEVVVSSWFGRREVVRVREALVRNRDGRQVQVDGEHVGAPRRVSVSVVPADLRVVVP